MMQKLDHKRSSPRVVSPRVVSPKPSDLYLFMQTLRNGPQIP
jgi:hypothetical protein